MTIALEPQSAAFSVMTHFLPKRLVRCAVLALWALLTMAGSVMVHNTWHAAHTQHLQALQVVLELRPSDSMTRDTQTNAALQVLNNDTSIASVEVLNPEAMRAALTPWLGSIANDELPNAQLLRITVQSGQDVQSVINNLAKLADDIPGGNLADYYRASLPQMQEQAQRSFYNAVGVGCGWLALALLSLCYLPARWLYRHSAAKGLLLHFGAEPKRLRQALWQQWQLDALHSSVLIIVMFALWQIYQGNVVFVWLLLWLPIQSIVLWWQARRLITQ